MHWSPNTSTVHPTIHRFLDWWHSNLGTSFRARSHRPSVFFSSPLLSVFRPLFWIPGVSWPSLHSRRQTLPLARAIDQPCPSGDCCLRTTSKKCIHSYWYSLPLTSLILLTLLTRCCSNAQHPSQKEISMIIAEKAWMHCRTDQAMDKCNQTWMHASNGWRMKRQQWGTGHCSLDEEIQVVMRERMWR